jgi:hypothetical protein
MRLGCARLTRAGGRRYVRFRAARAYRLPLMVLDVRFAVGDPFDATPLLAHP